MSNENACECMRHAHTVIVQLQSTQQDNVNNHMTVYLISMSW